MNFVSVAFLFLFAAVFAARLLIGREGREPGYLVALLVASLFFYGWHTPAYLGLLLLDATISFSAGLALARETRPRQRRRIAALAVSLDLGMLAFFKYADFFLESFGALARSLGLEAGIKPLGIALPIGISFYTFQSLSYTIDSYRGQVAPMTSFWRYLMFVSFFPQLVAGPIVRATEFLPQLARRRRLERRTVLEALYLLVQGYFLKMVIADNLAALVNGYWSRAATGGGSAALSVLMIVFFAVQIFADFAGYSNIARGLAYLLGFRLPLNFNAPYIAGSFQDFWRRWHITLSSWLRDYLYLPLGGNRGSRTRTCINLMIVMLLGGLWHGAAMTFVVWGAVHGVALVLERLVGMHDAARRGRAARVLWPLLVQATVLLAWLPFRSGSMAEASAIAANLAGPLYTAADAPVATGLAFVLPVVLLHLRTAGLEGGWLPPLAAAERAFYAGLMAYLILTVPGQPSAFVYFQF
jgi:D-alanyl-lipoteichoic acid acyltransferase DltB (MBOAT superfamily)